MEENLQQSQYDTSPVQTNRRRCKGERSLANIAGSVDCLAGTSPGCTCGSGESHLPKAGRRPQRSLSGNAVRSGSFCRFPRKDYTRASTAGTDLDNHTRARNIQDCWGTSRFRYCPAGGGSSATGQLQHGCGLDWGSCDRDRHTGRHHKGPTACSNVSRFYVFIDDLGSCSSSSQSCAWFWGSSGSRSTDHTLEATCPRTQRPSWEESKTRSPTAMDVGGYGPHTRRGPESCGHPYRRRRGASTRTCTAVGVAVMVYLVVTSHVLCRQSRLRFDRRTFYKCGARDDATTASGCADRRCYGGSGRGPVARVGAHDHGAAGATDGWVVRQVAGISANGQTVPECAAEAASRARVSSADDAWSCFGPLQLRSLNCTRVVVSQCVARTWRSVCWLYSASHLDSGSRTGTCHSAVPFSAGRAQSSRRPRSVSLNFCMCSSICASCIHAGWQGILWQWVLALSFLAGLGFLWVRFRNDFQALVVPLQGLHPAYFWSRHVSAGSRLGRRCRLERQDRTAQVLLPSQDNGVCKGPSRLRCKGVFLLWLVLTPSAQSVQVWRQATLHGQPVFNTGTVPGTRNLQDLRPTRLPNLPVVSGRAGGGDEYYREICVFAPDLRSCHSALLVDTRLRGRALEVSICRALGRQAAEWECYRVQEALPALPQEQYVLRRTSTSWHLSVVPVDLRPVGGRISLAFADRVMPCGAIAHMAIADQAGLECPADLLCRTSQGWFDAAAAILLLPHCDAFQVWPLHLVQAAPPPTTLTLLRQTSGSDRFDGSLEPTEGPERAQGMRETGQAVVISDNGILYCPVDGYADRDSLRSNVLFAYLGPSGLGIEYGGITHFARVLPPLPDLPAVQFVASCCEGLSQPTVVDLRAIQGSLQVCCTAPDATPAQRIETAVVFGGEPDPANPVLGRLSCGALQVLHREQIVNPFVPLIEQPPTPLVVLPRRPNLGSGWDGTAHTLDDLGDAVRPTPATTILGVVVLALACKGLAGWQGFLIMLGGLHWHLTSVAASPAQTSCSPQPGGSVVGEWQSYDSSDDRLTDVGTLASAVEHVRLAALLYCSPPGETLRWHARPSTTGVKLAYFRFVVWAPHCQYVLFLPDDSTFAGVHDLLGRLRAVPGRDKPVLVQPQAFMHAIQFVSPPIDSDLIAVLVDTGHDRICLDVARRTAGASILSALRVLCPSRSFQLDPQLPVTVRHGHVVLACGDDACTADVGVFVVPASGSLGGDWLQQHEEVLLTAADLGLVRLRVPRGYTPQRLQLALKQWLGTPRCAGAELQRVPASRSGVPIFCLPRPGASTLTVVLHDICDSLGDIIVVTVDSPTNGVLPLKHLTQGPFQHFWDDVLLREPSPCVCTCIAAERSSTGFPYSCTRLGLDYARARLLGWRPSLESRVHTADLVSHAGALGIQWDILREAHTAEAATQSTPLHWPVRASPLVSVSAPVRRMAQRCVPADGFFPAGTYYHLECPFMGVQCHVPCLPRYHLWAVRLGDEVLGACTQSITWHDIAQVAGLSAWDLPQTLIHEGVLSWEWPQDLSAMSGHCGQVFYQGDVVDNCWKGGKKSSPEHPSHDQDAVSVSDIDPDISQAGLSASTALLLCTFRSSVFFIVAALHLPWVAFGTRDIPALPDTAPALRDVAFGYNSTQTCSVAWCHELACQSTHFGVTADALAAYFRAHSPFEIVRIFLWKPLAGPLAFEVHRDSGPAELERMLRAAGHNLDHGLIIAFDTSTTSVDLLSVPIGPTVWWIIRDGIARELLRPVALWHEARRRYVVTLNSHGQANAVTCSPEAAAMRRLPQGVRGYTSMPLSRIYGHLTHHGLVLTEATIGSIAAAASIGCGQGISLRLWALLSAAFWLPGALAMQQNTPWTPVPSQPRGSPHAWVSVPLQPRCMRVWTHTIEAPVMFDYQPRPNPEYLTRHLAHLGRGVPPVGDFVWTTPTVVQGVAHLLHIPPNCVPPMLFWLLHYRGRAAVVAVPPGNFDWSRVAQLAHDLFGADLFRRNAFSIQHQNYVLPYGTNVPTPPHGSILHLVRSVGSPSAGFTAWESVPDAIGMLHFDYDICAGPGGEVCLVPDFSAEPSGQTMCQATSASPVRTDTAPTALLTL